MPAVDVLELQNLRGERVLVHLEAGSGRGQNGRAVLVRLVRTVQESPDVRLGDVQPERERVRQDVAHLPGEREVHGALRVGSGIYAERGLEGALDRVSAVAVPVLLDLRGEDVFPDPEVDRGGRQELRPGLVPLLGAGQERPDVP